MYAGRGHTTPSTSENDVVIKICNLIEIKFFFSNRDSVLEDDLGNYSMKRRRRNWTAKDVRTLKKLANKRTRAVTIARTLKRTEGARADLLRGIWRPERSRPRKSMVGLRS